MCIWTQPPSFIVYIVDDCFYTTTEELKSCSRNRMAHKVSNSYSLAIYRNPPPPPLNWIIYSLGLETILCIFLTALRLKKTQDVLNDNSLLLTPMWLPNSNRHKLYLSSEDIVA